MHPSAFNNAIRFREAYLSSLEGCVFVEIGSQDVNGSLRSVFSDLGQYKGLDFVAGNGVDVVLEDPYRIPLPDEFANVVVCSSVFEHSEFFWLTFLEVLRILKPAGLFYLNVPSNGNFHRYPVDCWRFYPDSGAALVKWGRRNGYRPVLLESYTSEQDQDVWNDFVAVFLKDEAKLDLYTRRMLDSYTDVANATRLGVEGIQRFSSQTEDQIQNDRLKKELSELEQRLEEGNVRKIHQSCAQTGPVLSWRLETPRPGGGLETEEDGVVRLRGWVLGVSDAKLHLAVRQNGLTRCYPLNEKRPDVIREVMGEDVEGHAQLMCGFDYNLRLGGAVEFGFERDASFVWLETFSTSDEGSW